MIVTDVAHLGEQAAMTPALRKALDFLRQVEGQTLADGRIEVDGDNVYAIAMSYQTLEGGEWAFEGHRKYLDVQYVAAGEEIIGWADAACVAITMPYDPAKDAWLGTAPSEQVTPVRLRAGQLAVLYPEDAHAAKRAAGLPQSVKKIVVKVITEQ